MSSVNPTGTDIRPSNRRHAMQPDAYLNPPVDEYREDEPLQPPPPSLYAHGNHSVPSFPQQQQPPQYADYPTPPPVPHPYDPTASLDSFSSLHIHDGPARNGSLSSHTSDPIPRAPSTMSLRSMQSVHRGGAPPPVPRHANTLPPPRAPMQYAPPSVHGDYGPHPSHYPNNGVDPNRGGYNDYDYRTYDEQQQNGGYLSPESIGSMSPHQHQHPHPHQQQYQAHGWPPQQHHPPPPLPGGGHNPLHAAASDVLGMGPPPGAGGPPMSRSLGPGGPPMPSDRSVYAASVSSGHSSHSGQMNYGPVDPYASQKDFDLRPAYQRAGTSASLAPSSVKSKAVDLNAPPYTKEYIDQYRQRIKADPDPEAHFLYAKYLIDAAKHIRTQFTDQRSAKKYSEVLIGESLKVIRRLATQGDAYDEAQFFLANCYGTGALGLQVDHERAYHLYLQAAKQNHAAASYRVAVCNEIGAGTKKEPLRAAAFYRKAASLGDTPGMYKLGMVLLHGALGEQKNPREAISWLKRAAEQADEDNPHALHELALLYENQAGALVPYDPAYAKSLLTQAAQLGYTPSQYKLGQCFEYGSLTCPIDPKRSIAWYTKAAEKGDAEAELALSGWYLTGSEGVLKQSDSEAYLWARRAANKGLSKAEYAVGYYAEVGIGIKQDIEFAKRWYMRAAGM
ncbi:unnamed protein product [Cyclocybe aegerita]|uniref:HCP-like protein n=1 Tax=Cyclocybe aegerita TaxID=1973307 RepID=A0A8S0WFG1_CYCAE|nr:unnamed protein product [Cyclocybe aegerita]